jgi:hypothetical protein
LTVVDELMRRVDERLAELQPAIDEYNQLMAAKQGLLRSAGGTGEPAAQPRRRIAASAPRRRGQGSRRRSGGRQTRADQAVQIVGGNPGVTVKEIAGEMGINENYLYRLLPRMEREGTLKREGSGWALASG